jgi:hypothetical protein
MTTALELVPALVDAAPIYWDRTYVKDMRPVRGYPDYWRITDTVAFIDGPIAQGGQYSEDLYPWQAMIVEDENGNLTNTFELRNLRSALTVASEEVSGETVYSYKYTDIPADYSYTHTDPIDSISLEFDQSGRRLVAFESAGNIDFMWYDPQASMQVVTNFGAGRTPHIVTDNYYRTSANITSERLLFYVKASTNQIVYRKQNDRYQVEYSLPSAPADVVEILKVSKNLYGGLTVLYCYESGGELVTGSFTARPAPDTVETATDRGGHREDLPMFLAGAASIPAFELKVSVINPEDTVDQVSIIDSGSVSLTGFLVKDTEVQRSAEDSVVSLTTGSGAVTNFSVQLAQQLVEASEEQTMFTTGSVSLSNFLVKVALITFDAEESATIQGSSGTITNFSLGV